MKTTQDIPAIPTTQTLADAPGLRNAWQWLAMIMMLLDHLGYLYDLPALRYAGRLAMPLYSILFVVTIRKNQIHLKRVLLLALLAQFPYLYIFQSPQLNIIFGFAIFAWTVEAVRKQNWPKILIGFLMMWIPVSYGWYLYLTLATFYWVENKSIQRGVFAGLTVIYIYLSNIHPRQLLAICVPFIEHIKARRPNKYLYRYFYPGHLLILAVLYYFSIGPIRPPDTHYAAESYYNESDDFEYDEDTDWEIIEEATEPVE